MNSPNFFLTQLNDSQQQAVKIIDGPLMVIAGAGSGKTRVLTYRIAHMLTQGINPYRILALTFTNKAANEMKDRIFKLVGDAQAKSVTMGTFHSVFYRILRVECEKIGFTRRLTVYDTDDSKGLIKSVVKELNLDPKVYMANMILNRISAAKSNLISAQEYANSHEIIETDTRSGRPLIGEIFIRYDDRLKKSSAMDFDDLLYYMNVLLRDFPDMLFKYQNRFQYILVDEYQDTNYAQYIIIKKLAAAHHNICVVGDDAQSIYGFRGANIQNILNFKKDYPEAVVVKLEQNYRSTQNIVNVANAIIKNNKDQLFKEIWTGNGEGDKINVVQSNSDSDEAQYVAGSIFELKYTYQLRNNDFAILYRTNSQSRALEEALIKRHIPYVIYGGLSFYKRKEIKNILAYFRLAINNYDEESLLRIINYPQRGIGATTVDKLLVTANENNVRMWNVLENPDHYSLEVNIPTKARLKDFAMRIKSYSAMITTTDAYEMGKHIAFSSGLIQDLKDDITEKERLENVEGLLDSMKEFTEKEPESEFNEDTGELIQDYFPSLDRFIESIALLTDHESSEDLNQDKVKLMTIHSAKGLEFDYVFVTGMEENLFPSSLSLGTRSELEEERRLFYVAITRAKKLLTLTHSKMRYKFGSPQFCEPSRFVDEIPPQFVKQTQKASSGKGFFAEQNANYFQPTSNLTPLNKLTNSTRVLKSKIVDTPHSFGKDAMIEDIVPTLRVYHAKFGYGNVLSTEGSGPDKKALIKFETVGEKTLLLKFAKLILPK